MARKKKRQDPCVFCGMPGTTRDHVPPKGLFAEPRPSNLITVPACQECNGGTTGDDEFMQRLAMTWGAERSADAVDVSQKVLRAIDKPNKAGMRAGLFQTLSPVEIVTPAGLYLGKSYTIRFDGVRLERILTKLIKGMLWHVGKLHLPEGYRTYSHPVGAHPPGEPFSEIERQILAFGERVIGDGAFAYRYVISDEDLALSVWRFEFYRTTCFMGYTVKCGTASTMLTIKDAPDDQGTRPP